MERMIQADSVIIGAGPVGLFAVFQLGLVGVNAHIIDILNVPGGQCKALYPEKPIYDIPSLPVITGERLILGLLEQCAPFNPVFHMGKMVTEVTRTGDSEAPLFQVRTSCGMQIITRVVVIAGGGGALRPNRPAIPGIRAFEGVSVFYAVKCIDDFRNHDITIIGGGDSALDWLLALVPVAASLILVHRRDIFSAAPDTVKRVRGLIASGQVLFHIGQVTSISESEEAGRLNLEIREQEGAVRLSCSRVLPFFGLVKARDSFERWGVDTNDGRVLVDTEHFETSCSGIYAIGDASLYPGKRQLILCGFHEAAMMAQSVYKRLNPERIFAPQHSTSSKYFQKKTVCS